MVNPDDITRNRHLDRFWEVKLEVKSLRGGDISLYKGAESILALGVSLKESGGS